MVREGENMELKNLVGKHILSGIETGQIKDGCSYINFTLDGVTYKAIEDPEDGYRSYLTDLEISEEQCLYKLPDVSVICSMRPEMEEVNDILTFVDAKNGKEFLAIGTGNIEDYYPYCVLEYEPENLSCNEGRK